MEAFCEFRDFVTEDVYYGPLAFTAIQNYAAKRGETDLEFLAETQSRAGFYAHHDYDAIRKACEGKQYLNFNDKGLNDDMRRYLIERFPLPSVYESDRDAFTSSALHRVVPALPKGVASANGDAMSMNGTPAKLNDVTATFSDDA
jgi:hypothetical protein